MTLEFAISQIKANEYYSEKPFTGYISPEGKLIEYGNVLEYDYGGHDNWINPASMLFLNFVSYAIRDTSSKNIRKSYSVPDYFVNYNSYPGIDEIVKRGIRDDLHFERDSYDEFYNRINTYIDEELRIRMKRGKSDNEYADLMFDLLLFFKNAYKNNLFFDSIGRKFYVDKIDKLVADIKKSGRLISMFLTEEYWYEKYLKEELISHIKDIYVQYLGYDSIERYMPNGMLVKLYGNYTDEELIRTPRIITSSANNPNERFYNYLLMNWAVHILPRYRFNEETGLYEKEQEYLDYHYSEKEDIYAKEIDSIKRLVPIDERYKYFR